MKNSELVAILNFSHVLALIHDLYHALRHDLAFPATKLISSYAFIIQLWIILKRTPLSPLKRCHPFCLVRKGLGQKQIYSKHITLWMVIQIDYISCIWRFCHWRWELLFKFPFLQSFLLHYPKYLSYSRLTNIQDQITLFYFIEKCLTWITVFSTILQQMEENHKLCHLNVDQMYLLHAILIKRNVWQSLERIDLLELKVSLLLLFLPP